MENKVETNSDMDISDEDYPEDYREVEIHETLDVSEETITSEDLDNQSTHKLEDTQNSGDSEDEEQDTEETLPPGSQGDPDAIIEDLYNKLDIKEDDYEFEKIIDYYFKNDALFLKVRYVGDTLGKDNITELPLITPNKDAPIELARYVKNYIFESSIQKGVYNAWSTKVLKGYTRAVK